MGFPPRQPGATLSSYADDEDGEREMLVIRFAGGADKDTGAVVCAAFDLAKLDAREIRFGANSWRGDHYSGVMDHAIALDTAKSEASWQNQEAN